MMVFVPAPQKTVHNKFVREPSHEFHTDNGRERDECIN